MTSATADRARRRVEFLRELAEAQALRERIAPRRSRRARARVTFLLHTYTYRA